MKRLTRQAHYFLMIAIFGAAVFAALFSLRPSGFEPYAALVLAVTLVVALLLAKAIGNIKAARLIIENQILHIQPAVFQEQGRGIESEFHPCEALEVFVSCFGILLDSRIIKFNQKGIRLKAVEIGRNYLSVDYGTDMRVRNIRLLYSRPDNHSLVHIMEKFRFETGVVPVITQ